MKSSSFFLIGIALTICSVAREQARAEEPVKVAETGAHHRVWERMERETAPDGREILRPVRYLEMETGMSFWENGQWNETKAEFEIVGDHAVAAKGAHKAILPPNISGVIFLETPDLKQLRSRILGLSYFDDSTGTAVLFAEIKSSEGRLLPPNRVVYESAFDGNILADVEYVYTKAGFEQNVVLRSQMPLPGEFGLNPASTKLQVITEFFDPPSPARVSDPRAGLADEFLIFGEMTMGRGKGFSVGDGADTLEVPIVKQWTTLDGRSFLVEQVPVSMVDAQINSLMSRPRGAAIDRNRQGQGQSVIAALIKALPKRMAQPAGNKVRMAKLERYEPKGFVLDYTITMSSATNYLFKSDTTHLVSGTVHLAGTTTFEGSAILKFAVSGSASVVASNTVWKTDCYRPVIFTSKNDNSVGETISGSTGNPTTSFAGGIALDLGAQVAPTLSHVKFSYLSNAINASDVTLLNAQLIQCHSVFASSADTFHLRNVLGFKLGTLQKQTCGACTPAVITAENVTLHYVTNLVSAITNASISLTNCLWVQVTNLQPATIITNHSYILASDSGVFQTVNGGSHYLATNSIYRNAGTNHIDSDLLAWLKRKTTYPPIAFTNTTSTYSSLGPQAQRDTDTPDIGYHYDPLDYIFGKVDQNADLTFAPGTAVGWFRYDSSWFHGGHGIHIADTKTVNFAGLADSPCWFVHQTTVQENRIGYNPYDAGPGGLTGWATSRANRPYLNLRFTKFAGLPIYRNHIRDDNGALQVTGNHCEFFGGGLGGYVSDLALTNCLLDRVGTWLSAGNTNYNERFAFRNCTVRGGYFVIDRQAPNIGHVKLTILDTAFDDLTPDTDDPHKNNASLTHYDYNAFRTGASHTDPAGGNDIEVSTFDWQTGTLGGFYLPSGSGLIDEGSVAAPTVGLYHFTTQVANDSKETTGTVDIGFHYVGVNASGNPIDTDGDGTPDYLEDVNGNGGDPNSGETDWETAGDLGLKVLITEPKRTSNLP